MTRCVLFGSISGDLYLQGIPLGLLSFIVNHFHTFRRLTWASHNIINTTFGCCSVTWQGHKALLSITFFNASGPPHLSVPQRHTYQRVIKASMISFGLTLAVMGYSYLCTTTAKTEQLLLGIFFPPEGQFSQRGQTGCCSGNLTDWDYSQMQQHG